MSAALIAIGSIIIALNIAVGLGLIRFRFVVRGDLAPLPDLLERSVSVERRAMAEWGSR